MKIRVSKRRKREITWWGKGLTGDLGAVRGVVNLQVGGGWAVPRGRTCRWHEKGGKLPGWDRGTG